MQNLNPKAQNIEININLNSRVPKYIQIADNISRDIISGKIKTGQQIPSINELSETSLLSRDTIERAYRYLRERKLIFSVKGKGYFITTTELESKINIFFMINKPSTYKMDIYNAFVDEIGFNGNVAISLYYCDELMFINSLKANLGRYDYYVIMPHFKDENDRHISYPEKVAAAIENIPKDKLFILDNVKPEITGIYGSVYQNFEEDIFYALEKGLEKLKKYEKIILVYPNKSAFPYPRRIQYGFTAFCQHYNFSYEILDEIYEGLEFDRKDAYITIQERDLVDLVQQIRAKDLVLGQDVGIISYNETSLKALLGITVISTDFKAMGQKAAQMILQNSKESVKNQFQYIERNSL